MTKVFTLETWKIFLFLIVPAFFPSTFVGHILLFIWGALFAYSVYMLGNMLYQKLPAGHDLNVKRFNFNLIFAVSYMVIVTFLLGGYTINQDNFKDYGWTASIIIPLHLYSMYGLFYCLYFIAKSIATIENNRPVKFDNYAGNFFLLWFFPIGIWWMHPKVRRIFSDDIETLPVA